MSSCKWKEMRILVMHFFVKLKDTVANYRIKRSQIFDFINIESFGYDFCKAKPVLNSIKSVSHAHENNPVILNKIIGIKIWAEVQL